MTQRIKTRFVGLDVHKDTIVIAVAEFGRKSARVVATVPYEWKSLTKVLDKLGPKSQVEDADRPASTARAWAGLPVLRKTSSQQPAAAIDLGRFDRCVRSVESSGQSDGGLLRGVHQVVNIAQQKVARAFQPGWTSSC